MSQSIINKFFESKWIKDRDIRDYVEDLAEVKGQGPINNIFKYNPNIIALYNLKDRAVIKNGNNDLVTDDFMLAYLYGAVLLDDQLALPTSILESTQFNQLPEPTIFAYLFLLSNNKVELVPESIRKILNKFYDVSE